MISSRSLAGLRPDIVFCADFLTVSFTPLTVNPHARTQDSAAVTRDETNHLVDFLCESLCNARCCLDVARLFRPVLPVLYASLTSSVAANTNSGARVCGPKEMQLIIH
jgi:hypothetical protein